MFKNLRYEIAKKGISIRELAERIGVSNSGLKNKLRGTYEFTRKEMVNIQKEFPECSTAYLFDLE